MSNLTIPASLVWLGDVLVGEPVVGVANAPPATWPAPHFIAITTRPANSPVDRTPLFRRDAWLAVTRTP